MDGGKLSSLLITVAPVVVNPETDSKIASVKFRCNPRINGKEPIMPRMSQKRVTNRKPSRMDNSLLFCLPANQRNSPAVVDMPIEIRKTGH